MGAVEVIASGLVVKVYRRIIASGSDGAMGKKGIITMAVRLNEDKEMVKTIRDGLKRTGGYCPCRLERTEENKCMCKEFRDQIADPNYKGYCHCMLYYKD